MAIIERKAPQTASDAAVDATKAIVPPAPSATVETGPRFQLQLAQIGRYVLGDTLYIKDVIYTFTDKQARILLGSTSDTGLPIWKVYKPKVKAVVKRNIDGIASMDMTTKDLPKNAGLVPEEIHNQEVDISEGALNIGDDSELEGILPTDIEV